MHIMCVPCFLWCTCRTCCTFYKYGSIFFRFFRLFPKVQQVQHNPIGWAKKSVTKSVIVQHSSTKKDTPKGVLKLIIWLHLSHPAHKYFPGNILPPLLYMHVCAMPYFCPLYGKAQDFLRLTVLHIRQHLLRCCAVFCADDTSLHHAPCKVPRA